MQRVGTVDERFQSYNVKMLEVTGGDFWKPYDEDGPMGTYAQESADPALSSVPAGMDPSRYRPGR